TVTNDSAVLISGPSNMCVGDTVQLKAEEIRSNGTKVDVTNSAVWFAANTSSLMVNSSSKVTALQEGTTFVIALYNGNGASRYITVDNCDSGSSGGNINAVITGPTEDEEDSSFKLDGTNSTSTGTIVDWKWYKIEGGERVDLSTDFESNWYRGAKTP